MLHNYFYIFNSSRFTVNQSTITNIFLNKHNIKCEDKENNNNNNKII